MTVLLVALALLAEGAPADVAVATPVAAVLEGVDPIELAGYVLSEHSGGGWSGACSDGGACGHYQLAELWERRWGEPGDRERTWRAARLTARLIGYARRRHRDCSGDHDWRAHLKCAPGSRDDCRGPVRSWIRAEGRIRGRLVKM